MARKWTRSKKRDFTLYHCGDVVIHESYRSVPRYAWGRRTGDYRNERYWRVYHAETQATIGESEGYTLLRDAKEAASVYLDAQEKAVL